MLIIYHPIIFADDLFFGVGGNTLNNRCPTQIIAVIIAGRKQYYRVSA